MFYQCCNVVVYCIGRGLRRSTASNWIFQELLLNGDATNNQPIKPDRTTVVTDPLNKRKKDSTPATSISLPWIDMYNVVFRYFFLKESHKETLTTLQPNNK